MAHKFGAFLQTFLLFYSKYLELHDAIFQAHKLKEF